MASKIIKEYIGAIKSYCVENGLSFDKLRTCTYCYGKNDLIFLYADPEDDGKPWILDETPMPALLEIYLENGNLRFVQTDITHKHLGVAGGAEERPAVKRAPVRESAVA
jgi:hypothetical protein